MSSLKKSRNKSRVNLYRAGNLYLCNISAPQAFELFDSVEEKMARSIFLKFVLTFVSLFIMVQINLSAKPEKPDWVDQLMSYKDIKKKAINSNIGMTVAACFGMSLAFPYAMNDLSSDDVAIFDNLVSIVQQLVESHDTNTKRIKPSSREWLPYARGEMGAARGQMLSCPSTNIIKLNISGSEVLGYGIEEALSNIGFDSYTYQRYDVTVDSVKQALRDVFLTDKGGIPIDNLVYNESKVIHSKIQDEILGDRLIRTENIKSSLEKGVKPSSAINMRVLKEYLTKNELYAYNIAIRTGDVKIVRNLTNEAVKRSRQKADKDLA